MKERVASFLVPVLTAFALLYQVLGSLRIAVTHPATLPIIGITLAIAIAAGLLAALGPMWLRVGALALCAFVFIDVTFRLSDVFEHLRPELRRQAARDEQRVSDIRAIQAALEEHIARVGSLPIPTQYGEASGPQEFWKDWWDVSSEDRNADGRPFLEFLVDAGILPSVPVDPVNQAAADDPRSGKQYVYFVVPPGYTYGTDGVCDARPNRWFYMLAITDIEGDLSRPPTTVAGSGCQCLWRDAPNFFQQHFDYVVCGTFDITPETLARAAKREAAELAAKEAEAVRIHGQQDRRRVADLLQIRQALQKYLATAGPLPAPSEYGEAERSDSNTFWQSYWDVSGEDGDGDGRMFLDFLVESGTVASVPVDPDNESAANGDPRGGRQYVYFLVPPQYDYEGGSAVGQNEWVYMLGITDLRSESTRPPKKIAGSGCEALWRDQPNYFQQHFDYVVCGTFSR
ncbi:MAG TPA: hypothetical protein VGQ76_11260 [Thermoanaerobaculia bacterium]|jgi:hypothetical protein|nr:hypothetical protein [Thermoanaerobaculia bacterium]